MAHKIVAEMGGTVIRVDAEIGAQLEEEDIVLTLESMKMEIPVTAPVSGKLASLDVAEGDQIEEGQTLGTMEG